MPGQHYLEFLDFTTGTRLGISTGETGDVSPPSVGAVDASNGFRRLTTRKVVNSPGSIEFEVPSAHPLLQFADKTIVVDWRRDQKYGIDWYRHQIGLIRDPSYFSNKGNRYVTVSAMGLKGLLSWYIVAWPAAVNLKTLFTAEKAETVMKNIVKSNCVSGSNTSALGRDRTGPDYGISNEGDGTRGNTINWTANRTHSVLEELQAIALIAGGDFDLEYLTPTTRRFVWVPVVDKTATLTFAESLGNMDNVVFRVLRSTESTVAIVGGRGEGTDRDIVVRTGPNFAATNDIEMFVNATDIEKGATAQLQNRGDSKLYDVQARNEFSFGVVQTESTVYKRDYVEGDQVSAIKPDGTTTTVQIWGTTINWYPGEAERISVEVRTP